MIDFPGPGMTVIGVGAENADYANEFNPSCETTTCAELVYPKASPLKKSI
jgi:hypothetical protein